MQVKFLAKRRSLSFGAETTGSFTVNSPVSYMNFLVFVTFVTFLSPWLHCSYRVLICHLLEILQFLVCSFHPCPIHPICNGSSKGLTTRHGSPDRQYCTIRHGSLRPVLRKVDPSTGSHFARQLNGSGFYRRK